MISLDKTNNRTVVDCDACNTQAVTDMADGVIPSEWMTGQLWLDVSMSEQKQRPICFCPSCKPHVVSTLRLVVTIPEEDDETLEDPIE